MPSASQCKYWWDDQVQYGVSVWTGGAPTQEPVSIEEFKQHARIDADADDAWIRRNIVAARKMCETFLKRCFITTTLRLSIDEFPEVFMLPRPPLVSVTHVKYIDLNGVQQTVSSADYIVDAYREPGRITLGYGESWPSARVQTNSIEVKYVAGYGAASAVPETIKTAICLLVAHAYEDRAGVEKLSDAAKSLLRAESWGYLP